jgi:NAD(P)H-nitrite reductase large subunit
MIGNLVARTTDVETVRKVLKRKKIGLIENVDVQSMRKVKAGIRVRFTDNTVENYSIVFSAFGVLPNILLAQKAGMKCEQGVLVNPFFETSVQNVYAAGDIAQIYNPKLKDYWVNFGWPNAVKQGICAAKNMAGKRTPYNPKKVNIYQVEGVSIQFKDWQ